MSLPIFLIPISLQAGYKTMTGLSFVNAKYVIPKQQGITFIPESTVYVNVVSLLRLCLLCTTVCEKYISHQNKEVAYFCSELDRFKEQKKQDHDLANVAF